MFPAPFLPDQNPLSPQCLTTLLTVSGGTDIISCFMGSNPTLPVHEGEIQSRNLGMAVEAWNEEGQPVCDTSAELVCTKPFPSMPTHFWNDDGEIKYTKAYFAKYGIIALLY